MASRFFYSMPVNRPAASVPIAKIALISYGLKLGGSTTFLINFAGELVRRGIPVEVLSFELDNPMANDFQQQNIPVLCLDHRRLIFEDRLKIILQRLAQFQPTVVISTLGATSFEVLRYLPAGIFRIGMAQSDDPIVYEMMRHYPPWMDLTVMVSDAMSQKIRAMPKFSQVPVAYLPYGVPMCSEAEVPVRDSSAPLRILYLGRLEQEQKRVRLFPEILHHLKVSGIPFHWTIAGEGIDRNFLETNLKSEQPHQTISFAGAVRYVDVPKTLKQHDVFLLASDYEGLPLSLLEAMGYGLVPVVSNLKSGIPEVVDATNGWLIPVNQTQAYAQAIIHLHQNRQELVAKSAAARERVQNNFSVKAMTDRWLAALPATKANIEPWPNHWRITAPLVAENTIRFSPPVRVLRRMVAKLRR